MRERTKLLYADILRLVDPAVAPQYGCNLRTYLFDRIKALGFYRPDSRLTTMEIIEAAYNEIASDPAVDAVPSVFKDILNGADSHSDYWIDKDEGRLFTCTIQAMLINSKVCGAYKEIVLSDPADSLKTGANDAHDLVKVRIDELADRYEAGEYFSIDRLVVNTMYGVVDIWYNLLAARIVSDTSMLLQHVHRIYEELMEPSIICRVTIPIEYGYMCRHTVSAIEQVNRDLRRPPEQERIIDRAFLDKLAEKYVSYL